MTVNVNREMALAATSQIESGWQQVRAVANKEQAMKLREATESILTGLTALRGLGLWEPEPKKAKARRMNERPIEDLEGDSA